MGPNHKRQQTTITCAIIEPGTLQRKRHKRTLAHNKLPYQARRWINRHLERRIRGDRDRALGLQAADERSGFAGAGREWSRRHAPDWPHRGEAEEEKRRSRRRRIHRIRTPEPKEIVDQFFLPGLWQPINRRGVPRLNQSRAAVAGVGPINLSRLLPLQVTIDRNLPTNLPSWTANGCWNRNENRPTVYGWWGWEDGADLGPVDDRRCESLSSRLVFVEERDG